MIKAIVTDIEGTTSSISFVHNVLFPYAKSHIADFVREHRGNKDVSTQLNEVAELSGCARDDTDGLIQQLFDWIAQDKKITPLKALQGMIWEQGYKQGDFTGHVYEDVTPCLKEWNQQGIDLFVYSSGSVKAQKLIFGHTEYGDLTPLFKGYFDTRIGNKRDAESYKNIIEQIGFEPEQVLFLSDIEQELEAATQAGMQTYWLIREGDSDVSFEKASSKYSAARSFKEIKFPF